MKTTTASTSLYNFASPNLIALACNVSRAYEIAKLGGHTVKIVPSENCCPNDISLLNEFYNFTPCDNPDMIIELMYDENAVLDCFYNKSKHESISDIDLRVNSTPKIPVNGCLDSPSLALLKIAVNRLNLGVNDVLSIHRVAVTIAQLGNSDKIRAEHIAEAIQYKSIKP